MFYFNSTRKIIMMLIGALSLGFYSLSMTAPASAVAVSLAGTVVGGTFNGVTGSGSISFSDPLVDDAELENTQLSISFDLFSQNFTESDDIGLEAVLTKQGGTFTILDFFVSEIQSGTFTVQGNPVSFFATNTTDIDQVGVLGFFILDISGDIASGFEFDIFVNEVSVNPVPVPAALPLFGTGLALMGFIGWRRKRKMATAA